MGGGRERENGQFTGRRDRDRGMDGKNGNGREEDRGKHRVGEIGENWKMRCMGFVALLPVSSRVLELGNILKVAGA